MKTLLHVKTHIYLLNILKKDITLDYRIVLNRTDGNWWKLSKHSQNNIFRLIPKTISPFLVLDYVLRKNIL